MFTENTVTIITPATGHRTLPRCLGSVQEQSFGPVEHLVVIDGPEHDATVRQTVRSLNANQKPVRVLTLPHAVGKNGWNGHRIYGGFSFLVNTEFVAYLDEDNWLDPDHLETLIASLRPQNAQWAFSLRKIVDQNEEFVALDNCESLGSLHHTIAGPGHYHIDTNCYLLSRAIAVECSAIWYKTTSRSGLTDPDRYLCGALLQHFPNHATNRKHTVNYAAGNRQDSVRPGFFLKGNAVMQRAYPNGLPWESPVKMKIVEQ